MFIIYTRTPRTVVRASTASVETFDTFAIAEERLTEIQEAGEREATLWEGNTPLELVYIAGSGFDVQPFGLLCMWFANCERRAIVSVSHPILGEVPTCRQCAARFSHVVVADGAGE